MLQKKGAPRLRDFDYEGAYSYFVTCSTYQKKPYFRDKVNVDIVLPTLKLVGDQSNFGIYVYCFMPDHLHLLLSGEENSYLPRFMKAFKQKSSFAFRKEFGDVLWQRSYYDHVLRKEEAAKDVALYIMNNPVRAGLVDHYKDYPFSGSFFFDIKELDG